MWAHSSLFLIDVIISAILIRVVLGALIAYRGLLRFIFSAALLAAFVYASRQLQLALTSVLILALAIPVSLLLVVNVVPEFRRLAHAALSGRLFWSRAVPEKLVSSIAAAITEMGRQRLGGLFVFPHRDDVSQFINGGEEVLSAPNKSLLLSIFNTKSPRHDGAVVIEGGQMQRIGAVLPLASAEGVHEEWGTRHLAAVGLTEQCDAQVIVVSEERGVISLVSRGSLSVVHPATDDNVQRVVMEAMGLSVDHHRRARRLFFEIFLWVVALVMAILGSVTAARFAESLKNEPEDIRSFKADLSFVNLDQNLSMDELKDSTCSVLLRVPRAARLLGQPNLIVTVNLAKYQPGPVTINLTREMLSGIGGDWQVDGFDPNQLKFILVKNHPATLSIKPSLSGLRPDLRIKHTKIQPEIIQTEIRGNQWKDAELTTAPIDLSTITTSGTYTYASQLIFPAAVRYNHGADKITVRVQVDVTANRSQSAPKPAPAPQAAQ